MADPDEHRRHERPGPLSHGRAGRLARRWMPLILIVVAIHVVAAIVLLHATGILGPGGH